MEFYKYLIRSIFNRVISGKFKLIISIFAVFFLYLILSSSGFGEAEEITVGKDDSSDYKNIKDAVDNASEGDRIFVKEGEYREQIFINKSIELFGEDKNNTTIMGGGNQYSVYINSNQVNISGFNITKGKVGLSINSNDNLIYGNIFSDNDVGVQITFSEKSVLEGNRFSGNKMIGINMLSTQNNIIRNNSWLKFEQEIISPNVSGNYNYLSEIGIMVINSQNNIIYGNVIIENRGNGIQLTNSTENNITNNIFCLNYLSGILLEGNSNRNYIHENICFTNTYGISISASENNTVLGNTISYNYLAGIELTKYAANNTALYNVIQNNSYYGAQEIFNYGLFNNLSLNWWGHESGPRHSEKNPEGEGDSVTSNITFSPWLREVPTGNEAPTAVIVSIFPEPALENDNITFIGNGIDDGIIVKYRWHSNITGNFYTGTERNISISTLPPGNHQIKFQVQDDAGAWSNPVKRTIVINRKPMENIPPGLIISYPANNSSFKPKLDSMLIYGEAFDPDGNVTIVEMSRNNGPWEIISTNTSWIFPVNSTFFENHNLTIRMRVFDGLNYSKIKELFLKLAPVNGDKQPENETSSDGSDIFPSPPPIFYAGVFTGFGLFGISGLLLTKEKFKIAFYSLFLIPLYTRISRDELFDNENRAIIYNEIEKNPGINYTGLLNELDLGNGTLIYHLDVLRREKHIYSNNIAGKKIFYPREKGFGYKLNAAQFPLSKKQKQIVEYIMKNGPAEMKEIQDKLGFKQSTVSYNIRKLVEIDILEKKPGRKRNASYGLSDEGVVK